MKPERAALLTELMRERYGDLDALALERFTPASRHEHEQQDQQRRECDQWQAARRRRAELLRALDEHDRGAA